MSSIKSGQFLVYSVVSGLTWALIVSTTGYLVGRFLNLSAAIFEENILLLMLGFATFGVIMGFIVKRFAFKEMVE